MKDYLYKLYDKYYSSSLLTILLILFLILTITLKYFDHFLTNEVSTQGIVSFELAYELAVSQKILLAWDSNVVFAGLSLGIDFLYLIVYALSFSLIIYKLSKLTHNTILDKLGRIAASVVYLAALFDIIENIALIKLLMQDYKVVWSMLAFYCAIAKFFIIAISLIYILLMGGYILFRKRSKNNILEI